VNILTNKRKKCFEHTTIGLDFEKMLIWLRLGFPPPKKKKLFFSIVLQNGMKSAIY